MNTKKVVGVKAFHYAERRNFAEAELPDYCFRRKYDLYKFPQYLYFKLTNRTHQRWLNLFWNFGWSRTPLYHFWNAINVGNQPWIVTFEYYLPNLAFHTGKAPDQRYIEFAYRRLAHPSCKKVIAISAFAFEAQKKYMAAYTKYADLILAKMTCWMPPQKLHFSDLNEKVYGKKVRFTFVGADFFRKGGMEVLIAFDELLKENNELELCIVSSMQFGDYASRSTADDLNRALGIIKKNPAISHYKQLPNKEVIELFKTSDVGLLPSYDETFGYTVLEAQACGCPVITTNGAAFTEINNNECGWVIEIPRYEDNRSIPRTPEAKAGVRSTIVAALKKIAGEIKNDRTVVQKKGAASFKRIRDNHDVNRANKRLNDLYNEILQND